MAEVTQRTFDLHSWKGLTEVLQTARNSRLSRAEYASFRDLVLSYAQEGGDQEKKNKIESILATLETLPQISKETLADNSISQSPTQSVSGRRIVPTFGVRKAPESAPIQVATKPVMVKKLSVQPHVADTPTPPTPVAPPVESEIPKEVPQTPPTSPLDTVSAADTESIVTHNETPAEVVPSPSPVKTLEEHRARIMEIKREVHALVGNPVTLIDAENHIGRTYMGALLTAMKAVNPGSTQDPVAALQELEQAYKGVTEYVAHRGELPTPLQSPVPPPVKKEVTPEVSVATAPKKESYTMPSDLSQYAKHEDVFTEGNTVSSSVPASDLPITDSRTMTDLPHMGSVASPKGTIPSLADIERTPLPEVPLQGDVTPETTPVVDSVSKKSAFSFGSLLRSTKKQEESMTEKAPVPIVKSVQATLSAAPTPESIGAPLPVYEKKAPGIAPSESLSRGPAPEVKRPILTGGRSVPPVIPGVVPPAFTVPREEDLMSPAITQALGQLLHEWSLFASSGIFGTGPGGLDHPLYIKLSTLKMEEIVLGRYEGSQQKNTTIIRDYLDAWRHEQAVAYSPTETFEHYLRRVVDKILKRQKSIRGV